ncbi:MAG TPA: hypothetical protein VFW52_00470 [Candidatus Saccharimonadales bacterium]|nr:hypothetical protein [Candidatus Saccharimonadales bacterium]
MSLRARIAVLATMIVASAMLVSAAFAGSWGLTTASGTYSGDCTEGSDGSLNCHGILVSGSPEQLVNKSGTCILILAPSGTANMNCRKQ